MKPGFADNDFFPMGNRCVSIPNAISHFEKRFMKLGIALAVWWRLLVCYDPQSWLFNGMVPMAFGLFGLPHYTSLVFLVWNFRNYLEGCLIFLVLMFQIILWYQCFFFLDILFGVLQKYWTSTSSAFETSFSPTTNGHFWINSPSGARQPDPIGCWGQQIWAISDTLWLWPTVRHGIDGP